MAITFKRIATNDLLAEIERRRKLVPRLRRQRDKLAARLERLDAQLAGLDRLEANGRRGPGRPPGSAAAAPRRRRRARNKASLSDVLVDVVGSSPMRVTDIMQAAQKLGYRSSSKQFRNIVNQRLTKDKRFKRVGRGQYVRVG